MSLDLRVRLSDVLSSEQEMDKQLGAADSNGVAVEDTPNMSVRDAMKRFEQLSASTAAAAKPAKSSAGTITSGSKTAPLPAKKKQKPLQKSESIPAPAEKKSSTEKKKILHKSKTDSVIVENNHSAECAANEKGESSNSRLKSKTFSKRLPFSKRSSDQSSKVSRASSDADIVEKKNKHRLSKSKVEDTQITTGASGVSSTPNSPTSPVKSPESSLASTTSAPVTPKSNKKFSSSGLSLFSKSRGENNKKSVAETEETHQGDSRAAPVDKKPTTPKSTKKSSSGLSLFSKSKGENSKKSAAEIEEAKEGTVKSDSEPVDSTPTSPKSSIKLSGQGLSLFSKSKRESSKKLVAETTVETSDSAAKVERNTSPTKDPSEMSEPAQETKENGESKSNKRPESPRLIKEGEYKINLDESELL